MERMKYVENLAVNNIVKYTDLRSGTEVQFRALVLNAELE